MWIRKKSSRNENSEFLTLSLKPWSFQCSCFLYVSAIGESTSQVRWFLKPGDGGKYRLATLLQKVYTLPIKISCLCILNYITMNSVNKWLMKLELSKYDLTWVKICITNSSSGLFSLFLDISVLKRILLPSSPVKILGRYSFHFSFLKEDWSIRGMFIPHRVKPTVLILIHMPPFHFPMILCSRTRISKCYKKKLQYVAPIKVPSVSSQGNSVFLQVELMSHVDISMDQIPYRRAVNILALCGNMLVMITEGRALWNL